MTSGTLLSLKPFRHGDNRVTSRVSFFENPRVGIVTMKTFKIFERDCYLVVAQGSRVALRILPWPPSVTEISSSSRQRPVRRPREGPAFLAVRYVMHEPFDPHKHAFADANILLQDARSDGVAGVGRTPVDAFGEASIKWTR